MPGPYGTAVLDDFNRANSTGLSNASWSTDYDAQGRAAFNIVSNTAKAAAGGFSSNWWNAASFGPNLEVHAVVVTLPTVQAARLQCLLASVGTVGVDGYELNLDTGGGTYLVRIDNLTRSDIAGPSSPGWVAGDSMALAVNNGVIEGWRKPAAGAWTKFITQADTTYTSAGVVAMAAQNDTAVAFDDFGGGTIVTGGPIGWVRA